MVRLTRISTKGGDQGKTSLGTKVRVLKSSLRIAAIGDVDEANASLGVACTFVTLPSEKDLFSCLQNDLFDIGADLCIPEAPLQKSRFSSSRVVFLEDKLEHYNHSLAPLTSFVLPGGNPASAFLHQARTIVRRTERTLWTLHEKEQLNTAILKYFNRLSDLLFVLARFYNDHEGPENLWIPGKSEA